MLPKGRRNWAESLSNAAIRTTSEVTGMICRLLDVEILVRGSPPPGYHAGFTVTNPGPYQGSEEPFMLTVRRVEENGEAGVELTWWFAAECVGLEGDSSVGEETDSSSSENVAPEESKDARHSHGFETNSTKENVAPEKPKDVEKTDSSKEDIAPKQPKVVEHSHGSEDPENSEDKEDESAADQSPEKPHTVELHKYVDAMQKVTRDDESEVVGRAFSVVNWKLKGFLSPNLYRRWRENMV